MSLLSHDFWKMLRTRLRIHGARHYATTNPGKRNRWLGRKVIDRADELGYRRLHFQTDDNPALSEL